MTALSKALPDASPAADLTRRLAGPAYQGYAYCYPHKTAYAPLTPPRALAKIWAGEPKRALELYVHVPFCAMRCGFCNLFTTVNANGDAVAHMLAQLAVEAEHAALALGPAQFARMAIGGGTPTFLAPAQLDQLLDHPRRCLRSLAGGHPDIGRGLAGDRDGGEARRAAPARRGAAQHRRAIVH